MICGLLFYLVLFAALCYQLSLVVLFSTQIIKRAFAERLHIMAQSDIRHLSSLDVKFAVHSRLENVGILSTNRMRDALAAIYYALRKNNRVFKHIPEVEELLKTWEEQCGELHGILDAISDEKWQPMREGNGKTLMCDLIGRWQRDTQTPTGTEVPADTEVFPEKEACPEDIVHACCGDPCCGWLADRCQCCGGPIGKDGNCWC